MDFNNLASEIIDVVNNSPKNRWKRKINKIISEKMVIWVAEMDSECYSWTAYGTSEEDAKRRLLREWNSSPLRTRTTLRHLEEYYGIDCHKVELGCECK